MAEWRRGPIIGRGSSATVSLATSYPSGELFAVKTAELSKSDLLHNEQRILSSLNCLHIVSYLGFEATHLHYNLFLEYATGGSLSDHIENLGGRLDEPDIRSHTRDILTGLSYLHSKGIVHCDVKPQNILIGSDGRPKIADLGCARWVNDASYQVKGTPRYMAPEVARGEEQGPAADVWALGCTVLEMVTGSPPWPEFNHIATLHQIVFSTAVPEVPSWISAEGKDFLSKCLERNPFQRWTAEQLLKHPFLGLCSTKQTLNQNWISPKTTLDKGMWEMFSDEAEEEYEGSNSGERIRELNGNCNSGPNWTWDDNWVIVRSDDEGCSMRPNTDDDEFAPSVLSLLINSMSSIIRQDFDSFASELYDYNLDQDYDYVISNCGDVDVILQAFSCKMNLFNIGNKRYFSNNHY